MWGFIIIGGFVTFTVFPTLIKAIFENNHPKMRGVAGEARVNSCLRKFKGAGFERVQDIMLKIGDKTSQIDNILISRYGIFVIETKNFAGIINGSLKKRMWVQNYLSQKKPREFYNPIWQNEGHIKALKSLLGKDYLKLPFYNIVAFSDDCKIPDIPGVINFSHLRSYIKSLTKGEPLFSEEDVQNIKALLEKSNIKDRKARAEHVEQAKKSQSYSLTKEKTELIRQRAEAHSEMAMKIKSLYSDSRLMSETALDEHIRSAKEVKVEKATPESKDIKLNRPSEFNRE